MSNLQQEFYNKNRKEKKNIILCFDNEKIITILSKLLTPVANIISTDNNACSWTYEEYTQFKKINIDVVFTGVLMDGVDGFLIMKDIMSFNKEQVVCSISKKEENELFEIMFPKTHHLKLPIDLNNFFKICIDLDI